MLEISVVGLVAFFIVSFLLGGSAGWAACLFRVSFDKTIFILKKGDLVVRQEVFDKLCAIAKVRSTNPSLLFDRDGFLKMDQDDDDEEPKKK